MPTPTLWYVNVFVRDLGRAIEFYGEALGLELRHANREHGYASFDAGPVSLGLAEVRDPSGEAAPPVGRHTGIGLGVADLLAAYEQLRARGVRFTLPPEKQPWGGFMAVFADPDGNLFYLDQLREE
jgi:predicted enzyme related to lactoylglutathione lyase